MVQSSHRGTKGKKTMTVTLNLAPEEEAQLQAHAAQRGLPTEEYIGAVLRHEFLREAQMPPSAAPHWEGRSLAEALAGRIGLFSSETEDGEPSHTAENTGAEFTKIVVEKHRKRGLDL